MIEFKKTTLEGVLEIRLDPFYDERGSYIELFNNRLYKEHGIALKFVQDDISTSKKNVLRGIHGDCETWKLISCLYGEFFFVVVNCDVASKDFGKWESFILSDKEPRQILVPPKHGNAHLALTEKVIFHYKQTTYYNPKRQFTYKWDDPRFKIQWPAVQPILSKRDQTGYFVS